MVTTDHLTLIRKMNECAREIFYAMSFLENDHPARANLLQALKSLGVDKPALVGLSDSVLEYRCSCSESKEACPLHGIAASNARENEYWKKNRK